MPLFKVAMHLIPIQAGTYRAGMCTCSATVCQPCYMRASTSPKNYAHLPGGKRVVKQ
jgi:hypothetical protein